MWAARMNPTVPWDEWDAWDELLKVLGFGYFLVSSLP
jgi:hypothetical protein